MAMRLCGGMLLLCFTLPALSEPATKLAWTKKFGGSDNDQVRAMVTDAQGNIYIAGTTTSMDLPANGVYSTPRGTNVYRLPAPAPEPQPLRTAIGGWTGAIAAAADQSGVVYVATTSGLMRTNDSGTTWQAIKTAFDNAETAIGTIALDPRDPNVVYVSAGSVGIFKTTDGGKTWAQLLQAEGVGLGAEGITVDPNAPSTVYATAFTGQSAAYRSDDAGVSWVKLSAAVDQIAVDASKPGAIYGFSEAARDYRLWRSMDRGATWAQQDVPTGCNPNFALLSDPVAHPNLYLMCANAVFRSRDQGATWQQLPVPVQDDDRLFSIAADSIAPLLYVASEYGGVYRSVDGGTTWTHAAAVSGYLAAAGGVLFIGSGRDTDAFAAKLTPQGDRAWVNLPGRLGRRCGEFNRARSIGQCIRRGHHALVRFSGHGGRLQRRFCLAHRRVRDQACAGRFASPVLVALEAVWRLERAGRRSVGECLCDWLYLGRDRDDPGGGLPRCR